MLRVIGFSLALAALAGCAQDRDSRYVPGVFDPICAPDGSVVYVQYSSSTGSYDGAKASRENCPWNKE